MEDGQVIAQVHEMGVGASKKFRDLSLKVPTTSGVFRVRWEGPQLLELPRCSLHFLASFETESAWGDLRLQATV